MIQLDVETTTTATTSTTADPSSSMPSPVTDDTLGTIYHTLSFSYYFSGQYFALPVYRVQYFVG